MKLLELKQKLDLSFGGAILKETEFLNEVTLEIEKIHLKEILSYLKQSPEPGYTVLSDLTAVDYVDPIQQTKIVYWLQNPIDHQRIRLVLFVGREESVPSVVDLWQGANWYEREVFDLFGVKFDGHPNLTRILMPDDWNGHPLRRDYPLTEEVVQFKYGVKPKIPSRIIQSSKSNRNVSQLGSD